MEEEIQIYFKVARISKENDIKGQGGLRHGRKADKTVQSPSLGDDGQGRGIYGPFGRVQVYLPQYIDTQVSSLHLGQGLEITV